MNKETKPNYRWLLLSLVVLGLAAALIVLPGQFRSKAGSQSDAGKGLIERTESHEIGLENYDIREQKDEAVVDVLTRFRTEAGKDSAIVADIVDGFVRGEESLRSRVPSLKVEYNTGVRAPEVITPDMWKADIERLTGPSDMKRAEILRNFVKQNDELIGVSNDQAGSLKVLADYTNPNGYMSFAHLSQEINGVPVFAGEVKAGFTKDGRMIRVINNLAPGLDYDSLSTNWGNPVDAVKTAFRNINTEPTSSDLRINESASSDRKAIFGNGDWATTAEKMYFPTEPGVARTAWRVLIWKPVNAYYVVVDAETGTMLWRKNITEDQAATATYQVYRNANAYMPAHDSPAPLTPGPVDPTLGTQGALLSSRSSVTLIGNESPNDGMNNLGWMTDGTNFTDGNNVEAGIDRVAPNGVDAPQPGDGTCPGAGCRTFTSTWNPPPGNPAPGDDPLTAQAQRGAVIQMFYVMNLYHDVLYRLGMNEQSFNFQTDNFGRGGVGNDRVSAEGQDSSGTNNANFSTPADGGRGRMQMFLWTGPTPDYDGTTDADVIIHEVTHGTSNRLHGNSAGLSNNMSRGMGEGWGDWYAHTLLAEPTDPINGTYTTGGYATYLATSGFTGNYYYGIRKFPKAVIAFTGGPSNRPHNPLTFADADSTQFDVSDGAFPRGPFGSATVDQVHNLGEIWSSALWEVRCLMVTRLGFTPGTLRALQVVTDGMKLAPNGPTFLQERDAIIAAASALPVAPEASADVVDVREGFRRRGMGFSAAVLNAGTGSGNTRVTEAFDFPNVVMTGALAISDTPGNNNGIPEPGENVLLGVSIRNTTGATVTNVVANVNGGANVSYGSIADGATETRNIPFAIPSNAPCGSTVTVTINVSSAAGPQTPEMRSFVLGAPNGTVENFDGVTAPALPANWVSTTSGAGVGWVTSTTNPSSAPNAAFAGEPGAVGLSELETPSIAVSSSSAALKFKLNHNTENNFDGMVLEVKVGSGAYQDILAAGGTFTANGYNGTLSTGFSNPLPGRQAWTGNGNGYKNVEVALPSSTNGQNVQFKFRMGSDSSVAGSGVIVDDFELVSSYTCVPVNPTTGSARADFDGDGKTDQSVFRPSEGNWYLNRSTAGFNVTKFGLNGDRVVPGDYDGDGKTDLAIFRGTNAAGTPDFHILNSGTMTVTGVEWGIPSDVPVVGDYDNDGKDDPAVYRPSTGTWYMLNSTAGATTTVYGISGDVPVVGDFIGNGADDITVFRPSNNTWYTKIPAGGDTIRAFGIAGDILAPGNFVGDDKDDLAVFRPSNGTWYIYNSAANTVASIPFGTSGDIPVVGDYDGDGFEDVAIYRNGVWWVRSSASGNAVSASNFGLGSDIPVVNRAQAPVFPLAP